MLALLYPSYMLIVASLVDTTAPDTDCAAETAQLTAIENYAKAAEVGEACKDLDDDSLLANIAIARAMLGHGAHAAAHIRLYEAQPYALRDLAEYLKGMLRGKVVTVEIELPEGLAPGTILRAEFLGDERPPLEVDYDSLNSLPRGLSGREIPLDPGTWQLFLIERGTVITTATIAARVGLQVDLTPPQEPINLAPSPDPEHGTPDDSPPPPPPLGRQIAMGIGVASAAATLSGLAVLGGRATVDKPENLSTSNGASMDELNATYGNIVVRSDLLWRSMVLVGTGVGGGAAALTDALEAPPKVLYSEVAGGAVLSLGGLVYSVLHTQKYEELTHDVKGGYEGVPEDWVRRRSAHEAGSGLILGIGTGLAVGAATSLIVRAVHKRLRSRRSALAWRRAL